MKVLHEKRDGRGLMMKKDFFTLGWLLGSLKAAQGQFTYVTGLSLPV